MTDDPTPEPTPGRPADVPPAPDPVVLALYEPPYEPGVLQLVLTVHVNPDGLWAESPTLPGLFATGATIPQLGAALGEAVHAYLVERTTIVRVDEDES